MDATNATLKGLTLVMPNKSIDIDNPKPFLQGSLNSSLGNTVNISRGHVVRHSEFYRNISLLSCIGASKYLQPNLAWEHVRYINHLDGVAITHLSPRCRRYLTRKL